LKKKVVGLRVSKAKKAGLQQTTLKASIGCTGIGLHSGSKVSMTLHPAVSGAGIVFRRTDVVSADPAIAANWRNISDARMATTVANDDGISIATIEHLMAALAGCAIDNALIEIDGPEVPIMDGSAAPFVFLIECAGTVTQNDARRMIRILKPVTVGDHRRSVTLSPADDFSVSFEIEYDSALIARQALGVRLVNGTFKTDIARARTFGFAHEVAKLHAAGLARGGSLDNAIVVSGDTVLNGDGLRYDDEFVRHKILDCIGDMYLAGAPILGHVRGVQSGHALNHRLLETLFEDDTAWDFVEQPAEISPPGLDDLE
jgi:UDP-3-O-[3-hydroxymyristoyl] N-acetylglucosamine deacetylase